jgi:hypothetical protein
MLHSTDAMIIVNAPRLGKQAGGCAFIAMEALRALGFELRVVL